MSDEQNDQSPETNPAQAAMKRTEKWVRRIGYLILFGVATLIFFPIVVGAIQGIQQDEIKDPFTGQPVPGTERDFDCLIESGDLIYLAGEHERSSGMWDQRYSRWVLRCQDDHRDMYQLLKQTRDRMLGREAPPELDDVPGDQDSPEGDR